MGPRKGKRERRRIFKSDDAVDLHGPKSWMATQRRGLGSGMCLDSARQAS
jgi:hypothetical protein